MGGGLALKNAYRDVTRDGEAQGLDGRQWEGPLASEYQGQ
jgi:hypothetical protein